MSASRLDRGTLRRVLLIGAAALVVLAAASIWLVRGGAGSASDDHVHLGAGSESETSDHYLLEVLLGDEYGIDAAHGVDVNADGLVAAVIEPPGDDRPRVVFTEGIHVPQDLSRTELLRRSRIGGVAVDRRGNIVNVSEHIRAGVTRRRAIQWGVFIGGHVRTLADAVWDAEGHPMGEGTTRVVGMHPAISDAGPVLALAEVTDDVDNTTFRLLDPRGDYADLEVEAPVEDDPLRPSIADNGLIVVSTEDRLVGVQTGMGRTETLAEAPSGARIGRAPAISADGRIVVYIVETDEGPRVHALRRDGEAWAGPVELDTRVVVEDADEAPGVGSQRHPPEIGDAGVVLLRGAYAGSEEGLWTVVLEDAADAAFHVAEVRPVAVGGDTIAGRTITEIGPGAGLAVPRTPLAGHPDAHWVAFTATTDEGPIVVRAVPAGSGLEREARLPDHHDH